MLPYVRMVVSLIEGVEFTCREVVDLLRQAMRQHSIGARSEDRLPSGFSAPAPALGSVAMSEIVELFELGPAV